MRDEHDRGDGRPRYRLGRFSRDALQILHRRFAAKSARNAAPRKASSIRSPRAISADSSRRDSPLMIARDAHVIDSSNLSIDGVVDEIIGR